MPVTESTPVATPQELDRRHVFLTAAALIEEHGHLKGRMGSRRSGYCLLGAVARAAFRTTNPVNPTPSDAWRQIHHLLGLPLIHSTITVPADVDVTPAARWNDQPQRKPEEVTRALRRLADGATWEEATK